VDGSLPKIRDCTNAHVKSWCCIHRSGADPCFCYGGISLAPNGGGFCEGVSALQWRWCMRSDTQLFFSFYPSVFDSTSLSFSVLSKRYLLGWLLTLNSSKIEFCLVGLPRQLVKINNSLLLITILTLLAILALSDEYLTFSDQIFALFKSCYYHIRELRCLRPHLDFKTASTIATYIVNSYLDYCNSLYYNLPPSQIKRLQNIHNSLARAVTRTPKSSHITSVLKSLHWLKINEHIKYKLLFLTYNCLTTYQPQYLHDLTYVQLCHNTRSSSMVTCARPPTRSSL